MAWAIGRGFAAVVQPTRVVIGRDVRLSSPGLAQALAAGLVDGGAEVFDIGLCGTEEVYFATAARGMDGGIMVTASHNPADYNGMKLVREGARPISGDSGLGEIAAWVQAHPRRPPCAPPAVTPLYTRPEYVRHLLGCVNPQALAPFTVVVNAGNGCAGPVIDALEPHLPVRFVKIQHTPDGAFPHGIPNPLLPENRAATIRAVREHRADLGIAWDGDFDRCFFIDDRGRFIEGYYIVGLLAAMLLQKHPGARIIHDPRLTWNTIDVVTAAGGTPVMSKTGHAFIKERMRREDAVYGGEMSAHHYFRDFAYCDSGMIPWLLVLELMSATGRSLADLVEDRMRRFPASGEINRRVPDAAALLARVEEVYGPQALGRDRTDGLSLEFADWRFNLRSSNTEPLVRLNVESRGDQALMEEKTAALLALMDRRG